MNPNLGYDMHGFKALVTLAGVRPEDVLRRAELPEDLFNRQNARVRTEEFFRFVRALEDSVDDPRFLVDAASGITAELFSPAVFAALCSPTLTVAVDRLAKFKPLIAPVRIRTARSDAGLEVTYDWLQSAVAPPLFLLGAEPLFLVKLSRMGTRTEVRPASVTLPELPTDREAFEGFLGCRIRRGESLSVVFRPEDAKRPFLTNHGAMWSVFEPQLRTRLAELEGTASFADRTRGVLLESMPAGQVAIEHVARRLGVSSRTLQRRLRDEGTRFNDVVRDTRERLSRHYLGQTRLSSNEIAYLLGFEEPNSFFRAFHSWTGTTPESLRQSLQPAI